MASDLIDEVRAGQVISSAVFNSLLTKVADLESRVKDLEDKPSGGGVDDVLITGFDPPGQVRLGEPLAIIGRGFVFPAMIAGVPPSPSVPANTVMINDTQITNFLFDSTVNRLSFIVPTSLGFAASTVVTVSVSNQKGEAQPRTYTLLPPAVTTVPPPTITSVSPASQPGVPFVVIVGQDAVIGGTNFLADKAKDHVSFTVAFPGTPSMTFPVPTDSILDASPTLLRIHVPDVPQVLPIMELPVVLSVRVDGNSTVASRTVMARRF